MSETKSTPGPWEYDGKFTVCIPHKEGDYCFRTNPPEARLIASAPDLYEALQKLSRAYECLLDDDMDKHDPELNAARAALAKARGEG